VFDLVSPKQLILISGVREFLLEFELKGADHRVVIGWSTIDGMGWTIPDELNRPLDRSPRRISSTRGSSRLSRRTIQEYSSIDCVAGMGLARMSED